MARTPAAEGPPSGRSADILTAAEFTRRVPIRTVQIITDLCAAGLVAGASKVGQQWRIHWPTFYATVAGPGVPDGEIVGAAELAGRLGVSSRVVRRATAAPGTPGKLPGVRLGRTWLYAIPAVQALVGFPVDDRQDAAVPAPPAAASLPGHVAAGPGAPQEAAPAAMFRAASLDHPGPVAALPPSGGSPAHPRGPAARIRRARPGSGRSAAAR